VSFPRYPAYKDSGVEWLREVPEHWDVKPLKRVATIQTGLAKGKEVEPEHCVEVPFLRVANVQDGFLDLEQIHTIQIPEQSLNRYLLQHGDVLMNEGGDFDKLGRGAIWNGEIELCIHQNHVFAVRPHSVRPSWLNAYTSSKQANSYFISRSKQSTNLASISSSNLMELIVPVVPEDEITQILDFLDRETAKIDALIAEQQRLVELLQEKRQAVISHAVTKGLNPNAPMKDSGVEWLGEVPEHWRIGKLKHICDVRDGTHETPSYVEPSVDSRPLVTSKDIGEEGISLEACSHISLYDHMQISRRSKVDKGDLLMPMIGSIGGCQVVSCDDEFSIKNVALFKIRNAAHGLWLKALVDSDFVAVQFDLNSSGGVQSFVSLGALRNLTVPIIPMPEQREIVDWLDAACAPLTDLIHKAESAVSLLQERRSALISAAVTGQIDVRGLTQEEET
jgi:type I restriction enzyme S subunit